MKSGCLGDLESGKDPLSGPWLPFHGSVVGQKGKAVDWDSFFKVLTLWVSVFIIRSLPRGLI